MAKSNAKHEDHIPEAKLPWWFFPLIAGILFVTIGFGVGVVNYGCNDWSKFDALTALFSGLAFAGMLGTLYLQKQELSLQRKELIDTRFVLEQTSKANQETAEIAKKNLRAQYLYFWIEKNTENYLKMKKSENSLSQIQSIKERIKIEGPNAILDTQKSQFQPTRWTLQQQLDMLEKCAHTINQYERNQKELNTLTQSLLPDEG